MKIMHTMASEANASRPQRRFYSPQLKGQVTQECRQSGASVAGVALSHGINANIVHRWLREHSRTALVPHTNSPSMKWKKLALFTLGSASFYIFESGSVSVAGIRARHT